MIWDTGRGVTMVWLVEDLTEYQRVMVLWALPAWREDDEWH